MINMYFPLKKTTYGALVIAITLGLAAGASWAATPPDGQLKEAQVFQWKSFCRHKSLADKYLKKQQFDLAIAEYEKAIRLAPHSTATHFNLAIAHFLQGDLERSAISLERLLELDPYDVEARFNLACLRLYLKDPTSAREHFERARSSCDSKPSFLPLIKQGLEFLDQLETFDPSAQDLVLTLIAKALTF